MCRELCYFRENKNKSGKTLPAGVKKNALCRKLNPWYINKTSQCSKENDAIWGEGRGAEIPFVYFFCLFLFLWPCPMACGISVPWPGIKSMPPALEAQGLSRWTAREVFEISFLYVCWRCIRFPLIPDPLPVRFTLKGAAQVALVVKNPPANAGDTKDAGLTPGSGRSPGLRNGNPFQYSCLENPMDKGPWQASVHGVAKSWTRLSEKK